MAKPRFKLKRSRIGLCFQLCMLFLIAWLFYQSLAWWLQILLLIVAGLGLLYFLNTVRIIQIQHLDQQEWSLIWSTGQLTRDRIQHVIDHQLYVVIYFEQNKPLVIWYDQVPWKDWKRLKVLARVD